MQEFKTTLPFKKLKPNAKKTLTYPATAHHFTPHRRGNQLSYLDL